MQTSLVLVLAILCSVCLALNLQPSKLAPNTYEVLKCNFHTHTTYSDGQYTPAQVVNLYDSADYDVLAITDHNTVAGYAEAKAEGDKLGLTVICGEEIGSSQYDWPDGSFKHIVALFIHEAILPDGVVPTCFDKIHAQGGIGVVAHPTWGGAWSNWQNYQTAEYIDGWEVGDSRLEWVYKSNYIYLRNHDFHGDTLLHLFSKCWTYVLAENRTESGVKEALMSRRTVIYYSGELYGSPYALSLYIQNQDLTQITADIPSPPMSPSPPTMPTDNLLINPSVETGGTTPDRWSQYKTSGMKAILEWTTDSHTGQRAVKITSTYNPSVSQWQSALWQQTVAKFTVGYTYKFRAWYKSNIQPTILLLAFDSSWKMLQCKMLDLPSSNDWTQSQWVSITVPSGTTTLRADARLYNRASGWAVFDDFELMVS